MRLGHTGWYRRVAQLRSTHMTDRRKGQAKKRGRESEPDSENGIVLAPSEETAASTMAYVPRRPALNRL
jgi:hypothetical protein